MIKKDQQDVAVKKAAKAYRDFSSAAAVPNNLSSGLKPAPEHREFNTSTDSTEQTHKQLPIVNPHKGGHYNPSQGLVMKDGSKAVKADERPEYTGGAYADKTGIKKSR